MKTCTICHVEKDINEFTCDKRKKDGHSSRCKPCHRIISKPYEKNKVLSPEQLAKKREYRRNYVWNEESKLKTIKKYNEKIRMSGERKEYNRKWKRDNADKVCASTRKRQAMLAKACPIWADHKQIELFYSLAKKMEKETGKKYHVDHIIPLRGKNVCGLHVPENLQILEATENLRKHTKW